MFFFTLTTLLIKFATSLPGRACPAEIFQNVNTFLDCAHLPAIKQSNSQFNSLFQYSSCADRLRVEDGEFLADDFIDAVGLKNRTYYKRLITLVSRGSCREANFDYICNPKLLSFFGSPKKLSSLIYVSELSDETELLGWLDQIKRYQDEFSTALRLEVQGDNSRVTELLQSPLSNFIDLTEIIENSGPDSFSLAWRLITEPKFDRVVKQHSDQLTDLLVRISEDEDFNGSNFIENVLGARRDFMDVLKDHDFERLVDNEDFDGPVDFRLLWLVRILDWESLSPFKIAYLTGVSLRTLIDDSGNQFFSKYRDLLQVVCSKLRPKIALLEHEWPFVAETLRQNC